jgi:hypothetical protein
VTNIASAGTVTPRIKSRNVLGKVRVGDVMIRNLGVRVHFCNSTQLNTVIIIPSCDIPMPDRHTPEGID